MDSKTFKSLVENYICPILTGSKSGEQIFASDKSDTVTIQSGRRAMHLRPARSSAYKIEVTRSQPFYSNDKLIVTSILNEILSHHDKVDEQYRERIINYGVEVGICRHIAGKHYQILFDILNSLDKWAIRTYEGKKVTFSLTIDFAKDDEPNNLYPCINKIMEEDFSALLSNSVESSLYVSSKGALLGYKNLTESTQNVSYAPQKFHSFACSATEEKLAITLTTNGEILIFQHKTLIFSKRRGIWNYFNHEPVMKRIAGNSKYTEPAATKAIYETVLDVSFSRTGGCIGFIRSTDVKKMIEKHVIKDEDIISKGISVKSQALKRLINGKKFQQLNRTLRKEILAIDGATIVDFDGNVIAAGAIIQIKAGSTGGGRLAATKTLAEYGSAIKISADGMVRGYKHAVNEAVEMFFFG
ncbi:MAG: hypothetical protein H7329_02440 [Opitutaceae bacterium]|nr:hypothetical protein [Cytophagales bacterium]